MKKFLKKVLNYRGTRCCYCCNNCFTRGEVNFCKIVDDRGVGNDAVSPYYVCDKWKEINWCDND